MLYGYARVSSKEQNEQRQLSALQGAGVSLENIFVDKQSGKDFDRPFYQKLISVLQPKDVVIILSIDRLGRNYEMIMQEWQTITRKKDAHIKVLDMPLLDTTMGNGTLDSRFIADLVLQILAYVAERERENIRSRQKFGIAKRKAEGGYSGENHKGKPRIEIDPDALEASRQNIENGSTLRKEAVRLGVSPATLRRRLEESA